MSTQRNLLLCIPLLIWLVGLERRSGPSPTQRWADMRINLHENHFLLAACTTVDAVVAFH